jgi:hypothetical protein
MDVGARRFNPFKLAGVGGAVILALIGISLYPPTGRFEHRAAPPVVGAGDLTAAPTSLNDDRDGDAGPTDDPGGSPQKPGPTKSSAGRPSEGASQAGNTPPAGGGGQTGGGATSGGGGSAGGGGSGGGGSGAAGVQTVNCPSVEAQLPAVPAGAKAEVDQNLAQLKQQIADANARLAQLAADPVSDPNFVQNTILGPLRDNRIATIDRIAIAIGRYASRPSNLEALAPCTLNG